MCTRLCGITSNYGPGTHVLSSCIVFSRCSVGGMGTGYHDTKEQFPSPNYGQSARSVRVSSSNRWLSKTVRMVMPVSLS